MPMSEVKYGVEVAESSLGHLLGFRTGDKILSFKGQKFDYFEDLQNPNNLIDDDAQYEIFRPGVGDTVIRVPSGIQDQFSNDSLFIQLFAPDMPAKILVDTTAGSPAYAAGLRDGDLITAIDSVPIALFSEIRPYTKGKANQTIQVTYERKGVKSTVPVTLTKDEKLMVSKDMEHFFRLDTLSFGFFGAFVPGSRDAFGFLNTNVKGFKQVATGNASARKSFMGPIQIAKRYLEIFERGGFRGFLFLTGALSMILAFVNILPIPALDGGHVMFLLYEMITRREPSTKIRMIAQQAGMVFILGLMLLIIFNDVLQFF
jgi:regulator of sigma E protease